MCHKCDDLDSRIRRYRKSQKHLNCFLAIGQEVYMYRLFDAALIL
jgi:hypothetical protein